MNDQLRREICGARLDCYRTIDAQQTRGGILIAWCSAKFTELSHHPMNHRIYITLQNNLDATRFVVTGVYGPSVRGSRRNFYEELQSAKPTDSTLWIVCGDFNVTIEPEDRTNNANDWRSTLAFANLTSSLGLLNISMYDRQFTWSNDRLEPHMARLDRFIISSEWNSLFPNSLQKALPNTSSDHCPVLYTAKTNFFRFENLWLRFQDFQEMIHETWLDGTRARNHTLAATYQAVHATKENKTLVKQENRHGQTTNKNL